VNGSALNSTGLGVYVLPDVDSLGVVQGGWVTIMTNLFANVATPVSLDLNVRAVTVFPQRMTLSPGVTGNPAMVNVVGLALLARPFSEFNSNPQSAAVGQLIYDTTNGLLKCWNGSTWKLITWS